MLTASTSPDRRPLGLISHPILWLAWLLILIGCYRFTLIGQGHLYWSDERCYLPAANLLDAAVEGDFHTAATHLFEARGSIPPARPGFVAISVVPTILQRLAAQAFDIDASTPAYYDVVSAFNVAISLAVTLCVFSLARLWTGSRWFGLLAAIVYSLLANANIWIRHLTPYNLSLLMSLSALWLLSKPIQSEGRNRGRVVLAGLLTGLGFSCYPGHYALVLINGIVALVRSRRWVVSGVAFGASSAAVLCGFEAIARTTGRSYLVDLTRLASGVTMGDPKEGYVFLWHYLCDAEGVVGIALYALSALFILILVWRRHVNIPRTARAAMLAAIGCYLLHATLGALGGAMVFVGRVLMVFLPFVVVGAMFTLMQVRHNRLRHACVVGLLCVSVVSFVQFALPYSRIVYPDEFLQNTMTRLGRDITYPSNILWGYVDGRQTETVESFDPELTMVVDPRPDGTSAYVWLASHAEAHESQTRYIGVNLKYLWYISGRHDRFIPPPGYRLVAVERHPETIPAITYEGRKPWERDRIRDRQFTMKIYQRVSQRGQVAHSISH